MGATRSIQRLYTSISAFRQEVLSAAGVDGVVISCLATWRGRDVNANGDLTDTSILMSLKDGNNKSVLGDEPPDVIVVPSNSSYQFNNPFISAIEDGCDALDSIDLAGLSSAQAFGVFQNGLNIQLLPELVIVPARQHDIEFELIIREM